MPPPPIIEFKAKKSVLENLSSTDNLDERSLFEFYYCCYSRLWDNSALLRMLLRALDPALGNFFCISLDFSLIPSK